MANELAFTEHRVARQEGGRVYCYQAGKGDPLVFLGADSGRGFTRIVDKFAQHFTCYILDTPGYDRSDIPRSWLATKRWTISDCAEAVLEVLDNLAVNQCSFVCGHTGAIVVLDIAANHPERVKKLVVDSLPFWSKEQGKVVWEKFFKPQLTDTTSYDAPVAPLLPPWDKVKQNDPDLTWEEWKTRDELNRRDRRWHPVHREAATQVDTAVLGSRVKAPTLLLYGERDSLRRGEQRAHESIGGSILKIIPDSPKEGMPTGGSYRFQPEEFTRLTLDFLLEGQ